MPRRIWFAEDIAMMMEMKQNGAPLCAISARFGLSSEQAVSDMMHRARKRGFDAYPPRQQNRGHNANTRTN